MLIALVADGATEGQATQSVQASDLGTQPQKGAGQTGIATDIQQATGAQQAVVQPQSRKLLGHPVQAGL